MIALRIATRKSRLALWQAEHVKRRLEQMNPLLRAGLLPLQTSGDELLGAALAKAGGKGLFIKELEAALQDGRAELAVHSMKDVPVELPGPFTLAAILARDDPRDALVSNRYASLDELPPDAIIGTSSLRRASQLKQRHPGFEIRMLRGNVDTRLAKLDRGECAAVVLAAAGLKRLGLEQRIRAYLEVGASVPAAGQGALGIECCAERADLLALVAPLQDPSTAICVRVERAVNRALGGNCTIPLGAYAELSGERIRLRAIVASPDGSRIARADCEGAAAAPEALGERAAEELRRRGATEILSSLDQR